MMTLRIVLQLLVCGPVGWGSAGFLGERLLTAPNDSSHRNLNFAAAGWRGSQPQGIIEEDCTTRARNQGAKQDARVSATRLVPCRMGDIMQRATYRAFLGERHNKARTCEFVKSWVLRVGVASQPCLSSFHAALSVLLSIMYGTSKDLSRTGNAASHNLRHWCSLR